MFSSTCEFNNKRMAEFETRGVRCPRCGDFLDLVSGKYKEICMCTKCGYYEESPSFCMIR